MSQQLRTPPLRGMPVHPPRTARDTQLLHYQYFVLFYANPTPNGRKFYRLRVRPQTLRATQARAGLVRDRRRAWEALLGEEIEMRIVNTLPFA